MFRSFPDPLQLVFAQTPSRSRLRCLRWRGHGPGAISSLSRPCALSRVLTRKPINTSSPSSSASSSMDTALRGNRSADHRPHLADGGKRHCYCSSWHIAPSGDPDRHLPALIRRVSWAEINPFHHSYNAFVPAALRISDDNASALTPSVPARKSVAESVGH